MQILMITIDITLLPAFESECREQEAKYAKPDFDNADPTVHCCQVGCRGAQKAVGAANISGGRQPVGN